MKDELNRALSDEALEKVSGGFDIIYPPEDYYKACDQEYTCPHCGHFGTGIAMYPINGVSNDTNQAAYALKCKGCMRGFIGYKDGSAKNL